MNLLVDTSVWSLALRRDAPHRSPEVDVLRAALDGTHQIVVTGLVLQEQLQGFAGPRDRTRLVERLSALSFVQPDRQDHVEAAEVRNACRRHGAGPAGCGCTASAIDLYAHPPRRVSLQ